MGRDIQSRRPKYSGLADTYHTGQRPHFAFEPTHRFPVSGFLFDIYQIIYNL